LEEKENYGTFIKKKIQKQNGITWRGEGKLKKIILKNGIPGRVIRCF
jgi:hypothetical protein